MKVLILGIFSLFIFLGCDVRKKGEEILKPMQEKATIRCVGRNSILIPSSYRESAITTGIFRVAGSDKQSSSFEVIVRAGKYSHQQFLSEVQKRRLEITRGGSENVNVVRLERELADGSILMRLQEIQDAYVSEISFLRGENMITVKLESYDGKYLEAESRLIEFASRFKAIDKIWSSSGFCLGGVEVTGEFDSESGSFWFLDGHGSDFEIEIDTYAADDKTTLLERMSGPNSLLAVFDVKHKVLRARERVVAGMRAQEWLGWAKISDEPEAKTLKFALDTMRAKPSRMQPSISITFNTAKALDDGTPTKTLVTDDDATQLWDAVIDSIKPLGV
jgi:hypothetical protein